MKNSTCGQRMETRGRPASRRGYATLAPVRPQSDTFLEPLPEPATLMPCPGGQKLQIERGETEHILTLVASSGEVALRVRITPSGPVLSFERGLRIEASGELAFSGKTVAISGAEGVHIESGAEATIQVAGDLTSNARVQHIQARLGNVNLKANDDVNLDGERIRLNC